MGGTRTLDIHNDVHHISNVNGSFDAADDVGPSATGNSSALSFDLPLSFRSEGQKRKILVKITKRSIILSEVGPFYRRFRSFYVVPSSCE
jgi:hypothetical protein